MSIITIDGADHLVDADVLDTQDGPLRWTWSKAAPRCGRCDVPLTTDGKDSTREIDVVTSSGVDTPRYARCVACGVLWPVDGAPLPPPVDLTRGRYLMECRVGLVIDLDAGGQEIAVDLAERLVREACAAMMLATGTPSVVAADLIDTGVEAVPSDGDPGDMLNRLI